MEEAAEPLVKLRRPQKIYLRSIKNSERDILGMVGNFSIKLTSAKVSLQDRINKDEKILKILKTEDMENGLKEILVREEKSQILITRTEHCLSKPKIHVD